MASHVYTYDEFLNDAQKNLGPSHVYYDQKSFRQAYEEMKPLVEAHRAAERAAKYLDPYMQATGEWLEYTGGRPLPNSLTGDTV